LLNKYNVKIVEINSKGLLQLSLLFFLVFYSSCAKAQDTTVAQNSKKSVIGTALHQYAHAPIDVIDVIRLFRHKDVRPFVGTHKQDKPHISVLPAVGYTLSTGFAGVISSNIAFYTSDTSIQKISSISTSIAYTQHNQVIFPLAMNIWSRNNKYNVVTEWRFMRYPSTIYDVGGSKLLKDGYTINYSYLKLHQTAYKTISTNLYAGLGYYLDYIWNIQEEDLPIGFQTGFQKYGLDKEELASGLAVRLLYDSRFNQINPHNGAFANIEFRPNFTFMGSQRNWQSLVGDFRKYFKMPHHPENILALWSYNWFTLGGTQPYLLLPSTGWDESFNTGRGYIQGRFRGRNMVYLETEYRFKITNNRLIGGVVFVNAQSFSDNINIQFGPVYPGWGTGLRLKLNKFSKANLCIDYAFGVNGSRGFFVNLGEVF
jgi:hypothetical protein